MQLSSNGLKGQPCNKPSVGSIGVPWKVPYQAMNLR